MSADEEPRAITVFGSVARGDSDRLSDRDLLLVGPRAPDEVIAGLSRAGWSCVHYSWSRLEHAITRGSLFIQHLKQDCRIISDPSRRLAETLAAFQPKTDYKDELCHSVEVARLLAAVPNTATGRLWATDLLCVAFRSLAIQLLANKGVFEFSAVGLTRALKRDGRLSTSDSDVLFRLRTLKNAYRRDPSTVIATTRDLARLCRIAERTLSIDVGFSETPPEHLLSLAERALSTIPSWYMRARLAEAAALSIKGRCCVVGSDSKKARDAILDRARRPIDYCWYFSFPDTGLESDVEQLLRVA